MTTPLGGKATTLTPVEVTTDPNTSVQLLDKDGRVIGSGTTGANGRVTITPTRPIPEGNVTAKATDNANIRIALRLILLKQLIQRHRLNLE